MDSSRMSFGCAGHESDRTRHNGIAGATEMISTRHDKPLGGTAERDPR